MTPLTIGAKDLALLTTPMFGLPKTRTAETPAKTFGDFLEQTYTAFDDALEMLDEPLSGAVALRRHRMRTLSTSLVVAWRLAAEGHWGAADSEIANGLRAVEAGLLSMSRRHRLKILPGQSWYRLAAWFGVESREHMFHAPFEMTQKSYRFSTPDAPTLNLGNSVYLCWLECGQPSIGDCFVSRFEVDSSHFEILDLACNSQMYIAPLDFSAIPELNVDPRRVTNSPYAKDVLSELAEYLAAWPLFAAVSVRKLEPAPARPPEYVIPQLLMRWAQTNDRVLGIRYFTSKDDPSTNSQDWSINLALPARTKKTSGYCAFLAARAQCTKPQRLSHMDEKSIRELVTRASGDRRQQATGRYMLRWPDGSMEEYSRTAFGKMEYWLDRPELPVASIVSN